MTLLLSGVLIACYSIVALFFARFWVSTRDRLFGLFALSFALLGVQRLALTLTRGSMEDQTVFYLLRLFAFLIILVAIADKNRR
jgi:hypothetical protein